MYVLRLIERLRAIPQHSRKPMITNHELDQMSQAMVLSKGWDRMSGLFLYH